MSVWSYTGLPGTGSAVARKDAVRFHTGQTSSGDAALIYDEEIAYVLSERGNNVYFAAADVADALGTQLAGMAQEETLGKLSVTYGERSAQYYDRAVELRRKGALGASPYAGGISVADKDAQENNTDRVAPAFRLGRDDYQAVAPGSSS